MTLTKAKFFKCDKDGANPGTSFYVQFNPNEITISEAVGNTPNNNKRSGNTGELLKDGKTADAQRPITAAQEESRNELHISMRLFFNTYKGPQDYDDVRKHISQFYTFSNVAVTNNNSAVKNNNQFNYLCFAWGTIAVIGLLDSMSVSYTMFANDGTPVCAEAQISVRGKYKDKNQGGVNSAATETVSDLNTMSFTEALAAFGSTEEVKIAARAAGVIKLRI